MRVILILFIFLFSNLFTTSAQTITVTSPLSVEKVKKLKATLPVIVEVKNTTKSPLNSSITLVLTNDASNSSEQLPGSDFANKVSILESTRSVAINANSKKKFTFYIVIDESLDIGTLKSLNGKVTLNKISHGIAIKIEPSKDYVYSLNDYLDNAKLFPVIKVESSNNTLIVSGFNQDNVFQKRSILLQRNQVLAVNEWSWVKNSFHWSPFPLSVITVPLKVRPVIQSGGYPFPATATAGLSNLGLNMDIIKYQRERYFATGKKSTHKFSVGFWAAPTVEEMDSTFTNGTLGKASGKIEKSKQFLVSTGFTFSYTYNDISFVIVPLAWDLPTSSLGHKWVYGGKWWWGFGIGISPKIFSTVPNK